MALMRYPISLAIEGKCSIPNICLSLLRQFGEPPKLDIVINFVMIHEGEACGINRVVQSSIIPPFIVVKEIRSSSLLRCAPGIWECF